VAEEGSLRKRSKTEQRAATTRDATILQEGEQSREVHDTVSATNKKKTEM